MGAEDVIVVAVLAGVGAGLGVWWLSALVWRQAAGRRAPPELPLWWRWLWPLARSWSGGGAATPGQDSTEGGRMPLASGSGARRGHAGLQALGLGGVGEAELRGVQRAAALLAGLPGAWLGWSLGAAWALLPVALAWLWPRWWLRSQLLERRRAAARALPFALDMMTLCLEAGLHFQGAVQQAVERGPPGPLRDELRRWLGDVRAGAARVDALRALGQRLDHPAVRGWVQVMIQADGLGMSLGGVLRAQADQRRAERFVTAERLALQAPVKMLFPLILCIFPCSFLILGFPVAVRLMEALG